MENNTEETKVISQSKRKQWVKKQLHDFWDLVKFASLALLIVIPIRTFIAQPFIVSGDSMFPTFHNGQYLIVDELSYHMGNIRRGDVVIFRYPHDTTRFFIKRIIGLPNETVKIEDGKVTIINKENPEGFVLNEPYINQPFSTYETKNIGNGEYFVMGDNRNFSSDSRSWGLVPKKLLVGRAYLRLLPTNVVSYLPGYYPEIK
jgi:signal peptidase I